MGRPARASSEIIVARPAHLAPRRHRYAVLPPGHPQGYQDCFDAFVGDTYRAIRAGGVAAVDGLPTFADGARAADITDAVLRSARRASTWEEVTMKLGFITACLPERTLPQLCEWAAAEGYEALEVAAWPDLGDRPFTATHLAVERFGHAEADATRALFAKHGLELSSLAFYDNNLHPDPAERHTINEHVLRCIDAAALLGCPTVGTFVGPRSQPVRGRQPRVRPRGSSVHWSIAPTSRA